MELGKEKEEQLIAIFRAEAAELIRSLTEIFLSLDSCPDNDREALVQRAFRDAHTLKGAAATLGFERISTITHHLEDVLGKLKTNKQPIASETVDLLLDSLDTLQETLRIGQLEELELTDKESETIERLRSLVDRIPTTEIGESTDALLADRSDKQGWNRKTLSAFRDESLNYIKSIATALHNLRKSGETDPGVSLEDATENLEHLGVLAAQLDHQPVRETSRQLKDAIEAIKSNGGPIEERIVDLLLRGLNTVLTAAEQNFDSEMRLSQQDNETVVSLRKLVESSVKKVSESPSVSTEGQRSSGTVVQEKPLGRKPDVEQNKGPESKEDFLRISEKKIDDVIAQVDELFEVNLQVGYLYTSLDSIRHSMRALEDSLRAVKDSLQQPSGAIQLDPIFNEVHGLSIQTEAAAKKFDLDKRQLAKLVSGVQQELRGIRLAPISTIYLTLRRQVRELSRVTGKQVVLLLDDGEHAVDRRVLDAVEAPINHILRNAIDHGIEHSETRIKAGKAKKGHISIRSRHTGDAVELTIVDDGCGIDHEAIRNRLLSETELTPEYVQGLNQEQLLDYLFEPGFSTKGQVTQLSGRGVGMDVVRHAIESLGGEVRINSASGEGTAVTLRLPLAMSTIKCLLFKVAQRIMAIPAYNIERVVMLGPDESRRLAGDDVVVYKGKNLPLRSIGTILGLTSNVGNGAEYSRIAIIVVLGERRVAFLIDEVVEYAQLILKPLGDLLERVANVYGISLLGTGELALVLNPGDLVRTAAGGRVRAIRQMVRQDPAVSQSTRILVVDDSITTRALEKSLLEAAGFEVVAVSDGYQALQALSAERFALVITDIQMPNMNGLELTKTIKSRAKLMHLPVILLSALGSDQDKKNGMAAGADAYIVKKDLTQADLVETIDQLL